jgi:hypothetical protein
MARLLEHALATSRYNSTRFVTERCRFAHLPPTAPLRSASRSYSGLRLSSDSALDFLFIGFTFSARQPPWADDSNTVAMIPVANDQSAKPGGQANGNESVLFGRVVGIRGGDAQKNQSVSSAGRSKVRIYFPQAVIQLFGSALAGLAAHDYLPRTVSIPERTNSSLERGSLLTRTVRKSLSKLTIWDTLATDSFGRPLRRVSRRTFPGAKAHLRLLVSGTQTTVAMRLRFNASPCTTTTGLRNPGPEPASGGRSAHQISPCETTNRFAPGFDARPTKRTDLSLPPPRRTPCSLPR